MARLKEQYVNEIAPALNSKFGYKSVMQIPKLDKVVINVACGEAKDNEKILEAVMKDLGQITGQKAVVCRAKKSVANFKLRQGTPIGCKVTLRGERMYEFVDRFFNIALPRVRDFRGINGNGFDGRGNFACGIKEQIIFPDVTIRKFPESPMTMEKLIEIGSLTKDAASFLEKLVKAGYNIFISGGTGSGKTTFLNALSDYIPKDERIITIEDAAELQIRNIQNLVRLEVRNANVEGKNAVTIRDLLKSSLRMRPDRIILGEIRDAAACELLNIMNTGHDGSLCTGHANSSKDMLSRMETLVLSGMDIPVMAIRNQIASALDIIIHLGRIRDKTRKVLEIAEIVGMEGDRIKLQTLFEFVEEGEDKDGRVKGSLCRREKGLIHTEKLQRAGIEL